MKKDTSEVPTTFPQKIYVSYWDHATEENPSMSANIKKEDSVGDNGPTLVATYILNGVTKITKTLKEEPVILKGAHPNDTRRCS